MYSGVYFLLLLEVCISTRLSESEMIASGRGAREEGVKGTAREGTTGANNIASVYLTFACVTLFLPGSGTQSCAGWL